MDIPDFIDGLRERVQKRGRARTEDVEKAEDALAEHPGSADLWILRGDLILLSDDGDHPLDAALESYRTAVAKEPDHLEAHLQLGHYLDAVADDPAAAAPWFRRAIELGGGAAAERAIASVLEQLREREAETGGAPGEPPA
ncbi:MAG TPA: hypothetical protein VN783_15000 [Thermoanaerobaculia bacterium]|nr:hypothetical protein [Thermoanaerobaculia bacterium]